MVLSEYTDCLMHGSSLVARARVGVRGIIIVRDRVRVAIVYEDTSI